MLWGDLVSTTVQNNKYLLEVIYVMAWSGLARQSKIFCDILRNERAHTSKCIHQNIRDSVSA